ncbi:MAG: HAMP domain-containing histidine kinase [Planctomycetes bacterium]|nr:HAMP domain-containing histidine kinase [Planctomycetota bacterium]
MLDHWPIRYKLCIGTLLLLAIVALLSISGFWGGYQYRQLARSISHRAAELPKIGELAHHIEGMRFVVSQGLILPYLPGVVGSESLPLEFRFHLNEAIGSLRAYQELARAVDDFGGPIGDRAHEADMLTGIAESLDRISIADSSAEWHLRRQAHLEGLAPEVERIHESTTKLLAEMYSRMRDLQSVVRIEYRTFIVLAWGSSIAGVVLLALLVHAFHAWVFRPLKVLINGSRRVASGDFAYRIPASTRDEMAELAHALNAMTDRFVQIRDDLNRQVRERTKEVVRGEQLASVGFLAAGVAHEINNPLASIAWSAEGLESRLDELLDDETAGSESGRVALQYVRRIQDEAFRCKEITEGLLDFSRLGHSERRPVDLRDIVEAVVDIVQHVGGNKNKTIERDCEASVVASVNAQEMKQVVLNLLTNALDSVDAGGRVEVRVQRRGDQAVLMVRDHGCGMTDEVKQHLFEPFFTRRRDGQGTGLGLSITYRIIQDHGGAISARSDGPGHGSEFQVSLPLVQYEAKSERRLQAA